MSIYLSVSSDADTLAGRCVEVLDALGRQAIERSGRYIVSLAGGGTPRTVYRLWARASALDWRRVVLVFGDERCVPPDDPQSNYGMVAESLLEGLSVQPEVFRMEGEHGDPARAARNYEAQLRELLGREGRVHCALMGLGADGHTASLFPGQPALREGDHVCAPATAPDGSTERLTLTVPFLRQSHKLMFLVSGAEKADVLREVMEGSLDPERLPAQFFLRDDRLNVNLLADEAAAAKLSRRE